MVFAGWNLFRVWRNERFFKYRWFAVALARAPFAYYFYSVNYEVAKMKAKKLREINSFLRSNCRWEVEVAVSSDHGSEFFRVYRLDRHGKVPKVFISSMPLGTPVGSLACSAALCKHYYQLGMEKGREEVLVRNRKLLRNLLA